MIPSVLIGVIVAVSVISSLLFYVFVRSRHQQHQQQNPSILGENHRLKYSIRPSIDIVTKRLSHEYPSRSSRSSERRQSSIVSHHTENEINPKRHKQSITTPTSFSIRSASLAHATNIVSRPRSTNWRQGSIVDPNQMALIQFTVPPTTTTSKYRRRSVAICNNINEINFSSPILLSHQTTITPPRLLTFHLMYLTNSQLQIYFDSLTPLPSTMNLQQFNIKIKLLPDGKEKSIHIKKPIRTERILDPNEDYCLTFTNILSEKLNEKSLLITVEGKEQHRKMIRFGQIGKIQLNEIKKLDEGKQIDFLQEIEKIKMSSIEVLIALQQNNDRYLTVEIQRLKGIKVDQKHLDATCYLRAVLLDRHRPLSTRQTKSFRINSTTLNINEQFDFSLIGFDVNTIDRLMVIVSLHTNTNDPIEHRCVARVKLASALLCSGSGTIHWQQFKVRQSFSMWHTLIKQ